MVGIFLRVVLWFAAIYTIKKYPRSYNSGYLFLLIVIIGVADLIEGYWTGNMAQTLLFIPPLFLLKYKLSFM